MRVGGRVSGEAMGGGKGKAGLLPANVLLKQGSKKLRKCLGRWNEETGADS